MDVDDYRVRLADAVLSRNVEELTKIAIELEEFEGCEYKLLRAEALKALGSILLESDKELGEKYLREAIKVAKECGGEESKRIVGDAYGYLLMRGIAIDEALKELDPEDPTQGPAYALALALKGDHKRAIEVLEKHLGSYKATIYGFVLTAVIPPRSRPQDTIIRLVRDIFRYYVFKGLERRYLILLSELMNRKLVGDDKAKVYAIYAYLFSRDKADAMQALKAAKDPFVQDFARVVVAETIMEENPEMAVRYALKVTPREDPRGAYVTAVAKFIASRSDPMKLFEALSYALKAYMSGLDKREINSMLVEYVYAAIVRTIAYIAYRLKDQRIARALEIPCALVPTFVEFRPMVAKACACAMKLLGKDYSEFLKLASGYSDRILDECLSERESKVILLHFFVSRMSRIFRKGFVYVTRARKRATIFLILYALLTFRLIFSISKVGAYYTYNLYDRRGVEVSLSSHVIYNSQAYYELKAALEDVEELASGAYIHAYVTYSGITFVAYKTIYGSDKEAPRLFPEFRPSLLISGRYIESDQECVVMQGFSISSGGIIVTDPRGEIVLEDLNLKLRIVGVVSNETGISMIPQGSVLVTRDTLMRIATSADRDVYVFRAVVLSAGEGLPYVQTYGENMKSIATTLAKDLEEAGIRAEIRYNQNSDLGYRADVMNALVAFFAATIVSDLYAVLLTRIRREEIAMLKTFGRKNKEVVSLILAELLGESFLGFILGIALVKKYVSFATEISRLITASVVALAFVAVVLFQLIFRLLLMVKSIGRIRPAEIARA